MTSSKSLPSSAFSRQNLSSLSACLCLLVLITLATLVLSGCGSIATVPKDLRKVTSQDPSGMVFCFIGGEFRTQSLYFRAIGSTDEGRLAYDRFFLFPRTSKKEEPEWMGIVFARLPPGDYQLVNVALSTQRGPSGTITYRMKNTFSIPFKITENEVTYLGSFMSHMIMDKIFLGLPEDIGGYFVVSDQFDRDFALLKTKDASVETMSSNKMILDPDAVQLPVFQSKVLAP